MLYFAYGSNMNRGRMYDRGVDVISTRPAKLRGWKLVINKKSYKNPQIGFANIIPDENSVVEGVVYDVEHSYIKKLDKFEGYPKHYTRRVMDIEVEGKIESSLVYIATENWVVDGELKTTNEYKNHILGGKDFLSEGYYNKLNEEIKTV